MRLPERSATATIHWFFSCAKGLEPLVRAELESLGAADIKETTAGVYAQGPQVLGLRMVLWSRVSNRVIRLLGDFPGTTAQALYDQLSVQSWHAWIRPSQSIAVDFHGTNESIRNTQFGAQKVKDAVVDSILQEAGARPNVDKSQPDIRLNCRLRPQGLSVGIDYGNGSLHWRGYRAQGGAAPLKETLAAAILVRAGWPDIAAQGGALIDPMCGTGTLLLEAALIAGDRAPGLNRSRFGFESLPDFNSDQWRILRSEAEKRAQVGLEALNRLEIRGYDADPKAIRAAQSNIEQLGLASTIKVSVRGLNELTKPTHRPIESGLVICNPPYGTRLGESGSLRYLYNQIGQKVSADFDNWHLAVLAGDVSQSKAVGLRSYKQYSLFNGALPVHLALFEISASNYWKSLGGSGRSDNPDNVAESHGSTTFQQSEEGLSNGARMFLNRLRKNRKRLRAWRERKGVDCYRLYDADMPEYAVAVDDYQGRLHVAEYQAPKQIDEADAQRRLDEVVQALCVEFKVEASAIAIKQRRRQRGDAQYQKQGNTGQKFRVKEGQADVLVNLHDYLDTGLFLDHRPLRVRLFEECQGKRFLNLFCYTGVASIHAALGGARKTVSVDLSNTYLNWYRENLVLNGLSETTHKVIRADVLSWLNETPESFDVILLDPPSFSNSKKTEESFDVQRDQVPLVDAAMARLDPKGTLYFSNNRRGFKLATELTERYQCRDMTHQTLDPDFERNPKIHQCWAITQLGKRG